MSDTEAFQRRLGLAARLKPLARIALLDETLAWCSPDEAGPVALGLVDLAIVPADESPRAGVPRLIRLMAHARRRRLSGVHTAALRSLVRRWGRIPADLRHVVLVAGRGRLSDVAASLARSVDPCHRASVCELALDAEEFSLAPALAGLFEDREASVAGAAERALARLSLLGANLDPETGEAAPGRERIEESDLDVVRASVAAVIPAAARERRRTVLVAAMALIEPADMARARAGRGDPVTALVFGDDETVRSAARNALRWSEGPLARRRALEWLSSEAVGAAAVERLARARTVAEHECVLCRVHLFAHPARARRAALLGRSIKPEPGQSRPSCVPAPEEVPALSVGARRGLARYLRAIDAPPGAARDVFEALTGDADAPARHACVRGAPPGVVADLTFDTDARVARGAMTAWSLVGERSVGRGPERRLALRADPARERLLVRLARSPHRCVRAMAREEISLLAWLDAATPQGRAAARRRWLADPGRFVAEMRAVLLTGEPQDRVAAIGVVRRLGLHAAVERELLGLCEAAAEGARARVAATAVGALAELGTHDAARAVVRHTSVADARVRANAVEGVGVLTRDGRGGEGGRALLVELKDDPQHRARANALRALLARPASALEERGGVRVYEPAAVGSLLSMLGDARAEHRLAGAWVAGRVLPFEGAARLGPRWAEVSVRVHDMAGEDPDARVRVRAAQCAGLMRARLAAGREGRA